MARQDEVQRFQSEAEAAANLDHPGIVPIYEVGQHDGQHYFSMGFVEGESLADKISGGPLPARVAAQYTEKISEAVAYAHERGVIHRDLKPANVLVDQNNQPKVTDFGLAKKVEGDSDLTATGQILGTPSYMPPEQAAGTLGGASGQADVYAWGGILYALLTGHPPFQADNPVDTLRQVLEREPIAPRQIVAKTPLDLETISLKCLEKDPRRRYTSAQELTDELGRFLRGEPIQARPVTAPDRLWRWCKRNPVVASLGAGLVIVLLALGIVGPFVAIQQTRLASEKTELANEKTRLAEETEDQLRISTVTALAAESRALQAENPVLGVLLAIEAVELSQRSAASAMPIAHEALLNSTQTLRGRSLTGHPDRVFKMAMSSECLGSAQQ